MLKKVLIGAVTALSVGTMFFLNAGNTEAVSNIKVDETGNVLLIADEEKTDGITAVQLRLNVDTYTDVDVSFEFNPENSIKISEYRYHEEIGALHIYIADSEPLFDGVESLDIGTISAVDADGNAVDVQIDVAEDALKYIHQNTLMEESFEVDIVTKPIVIPETTTSTTTTTAITTTTKSTTTEATTTSTKSTTTSTKATTTSTKATTTSTKATTTSTKATTTEATTTTKATTTTAKPTTTTKKATTTKTTTKKTTTTKATTTKANNGHVASDDEFCQWAISDYQKSTGVTPANAELDKNENGMYEITLSDEKGTVLDTYTINPDTGKGTNSANEEVNLPQTGNNSMKNILMSLLAVMFMGLGLYIVKASGVIRRKGYEE